MRTHRVAKALCALAWTLSTLSSIAPSTLHAAEPVFPDVDRDERFVFPRDHGAHPAYRTEWWYVTGWLRATDGEELGFQVTFFRSRLLLADDNPSRFAPRQLLFAHAALADAKLGRLMHDQRIARQGFDIAEASNKDADVTLDGWRFVRVASKPETPGENPDVETLHFKTQVTSARFALDLDLRATGPVLAQGTDARRPGYSQKGPQSRDASRYYSVPQLAVAGTVVRNANKGSKKERIQVTGTAWLDREWSSAYLDPQAVGWDWVGLNFDDGGALMAFQMRDRKGGKLWAGGSRRFADGRVERYAPGDVGFTTMRSWKSPTSGATWPVAQRIAIGDRSDVSPAISPLVLRVEPLMDNQELDSRASTGTIYWEGAVRVFRDDAVRDAAHAAPSPVIGRGYLELTGYWHPIRFGFQ